MKTGLGRFKKHSGVVKIANPGSPPKVSAQRLEARMQDYSRCINSSHPGQPKVQARIDGGGFHRPGSNKK